MSARARRFSSRRTGLWSHHAPPPPRLAVRRRTCRGAVSAASPGSPVAAHCALVIVARRAPISQLYAAHHQPVLRQASTLFDDLGRRRVCRRGIIATATTDGNAAQRVRVAAVAGMAQIVQAFATRSYRRSAIGPASRLVIQPVRPLRGGADESAHCVMQLSNGAPAAQTLKCDPELCALHARRASATLGLDSTRSSLATDARKYRKWGAATGPKPGC